MDLKKVLERMKQNHKNVDFIKFIGFALRIGFEHRKGKGSHHVLYKGDIKEILTIQNVGGRVKPYQVKQFFKLVEKYNMVKEESKDE